MPWDKELGGLTWFGVGELELSGRRVAWAESWARCALCTHSSALPGLQRVTPRLGSGGAF